MERRFSVTLTHPMQIRASKGGFDHRRRFVYAANEPADALAEYYREFPNGPEPRAVEEI